MFDDSVNDLYIVGSNFISSSTLRCKFSNYSDNSTLSIVDAAYIDYEDIICTLPVMVPTKIQISVTNNGVDYTYYTNSVLYLLAAPTITAISPSIANSLITQHVIVIGSNFEYPFASGSDSIADTVNLRLICRFDGQYLVGNASIINNTHLLCPLVPLQSSKLSTNNYNSTLEVSFDGGNNFVLSPQNFTFIATPNTPFISHIYPSFTPRDIDTPIYIEGQAFSEGIYCKFGDQAISAATVLNDTLAICDSGIYPINEITMVSLQISRYQDRDFCCAGIVIFQFIPIMTLSHLSPSTVFERSTLTIINAEESGELTEFVSVYGEHFYPTPSLSCKFKFENPEFLTEIITTDGIYQSWDHVSCPTPYNRAVGNYIVSISNDGVNFVDAGLKLTVLPIITITSIYPTFGNYKGGYFVTLTGSGFNSTYNMYCVFDNIYFEEAIYVDDQHINCSASAHNPGFVDISLGYNYMKLSDINNINIESYTFKYVPEMVLESIFPSSGPLKGGTNITITGYNFWNQTDGLLPLDLRCKFKTSSVRTRQNKEIAFENSIYVNTIISQNGTQLFCKTPSRTFASYVTVEVEATNGEFTAYNKLFMYHDIIYLDSSDPIHSRTTGGDMIFIYGSNFEYSPMDRLKCQFSLWNTSLSSISIVVVATWISNSEIKCKAPDFVVADISSKLIYVCFIQISNNDGLDWSDNYINITYRNDLLMNVTSITPLYGPSTGTEVTITGTNFHFDKQVACQFGSAKFQTIATVVSNVILTCHAPAVTAFITNGSLITEFALLCDKEGITATNINFTYILMPSLDMIYPTDGPWMTYNGSMGNLLISGTNLPTLEGLITVCRWIKTFLPDGTLDFRVSSFTLTNATVLSSTELLCVIPEPPEKIVSYFGVEFSFNLHDYTTSNLMYRYFEPIELLSISPHITPNTSSEYTVELIANYIPFWRDISCWLEFNTSYKVNITRINQYKFWCVVPNQVAPSVLSLCAGIYGVSYDCINMTFIIDAELYSIEPTYGVVTGHTEVTIKGNRFYDSWIGIFFKIYNEQYNFTTTVEAEYVDNETVTCYTHMAPYPGVYQYSMTLNRQSFTSSYVNFTYALHSTILSATPHNVISTGGSVITIIGENFLVELANDIVYCILFFDGVQYFKFKGNLLSSSNVTCIMPDFSSYVIETSTELIFITLTFNNQSETLMPRPLHIVPPFSFNFTNPIYVQLYHITNIYITGHTVGYDRYVNVSESLYCKWNDIIHTKAEYLNTTTLYCETPNFTNSTTNEVTLTFNLQQYSSPVYIQSYTRIILESLTPDNVAHEGGSFVDVFATGFIQNDYLRCRYDGFHWRPAIFINTSYVQCIIPPNVKQQQNVSITISNNGINYNGDINNEPLYVEYLTPRIFFVDPPNGPAFGGTVLTVQGNYFKNTSYLHLFMICDEIDETTGDYIEAYIVPFSFINDTFMLIYSSAVVVNTAQKTTTCHLEMTNNGQDYSRNGAVFNYYTLYIDYFLPISGSTDGGTEVIVTGFGFQDRPELTCKFHNVTSPAYLIKPERLKCESPPFASIFPHFDYTQPDALPMNVSLEVTNNLEDYTSQQIIFIYEMRPSIVSISPTSVIGYGLTEITVKLNNSNNYAFHDYDGIGGFSGTYCKFDDTVGVGERVDNFTLLCTSPPFASGTNALVSVSNNIQDWSNDTVIFQYINQTEGYYVNQTIEIMCPIGSYCPKPTADMEVGDEPRYKSHILCNRGYYQPNPGQSSCVVCLRGHSCKERGLSYQPICPAGFVCEVSQVGNDGKPCPFGYWCDIETETFVQPIIKSQPSQLQTLFRPTIVDGWNTQFIFIQNSTERYRNKTARINNTVLIVSNVTAFSNATEIHALSVSDINVSFTPRWLGERSDIPHGLVYDYPDSVSITNINSNGDSHPILLTAHDNHLYFTAFDGVSRNLYKSDVKHQLVTLLGIFKSNCNVSMDLTLKCGSPEYWVTFRGIVYFSADGDDGAGYQLWRTNGTYSSTIRLSNIYPTHSYGSNPDYLTIQSHYMYFSAEINITSTQTVRHLFMMELINETISPVDPMILPDDNTELKRNNNPVYLGEMYNYYVCFGTNNNVTNINGEDILSTTRIWLTTIGTQNISFLIDISNVTDDIYRWKGSDGGYDLIGNGIRCFTSDMKWVMYLTTYDNDTGYHCRLYFTAFAINASSFHNFTYQIWETDGTSNGTELLKSPQPCPEGFYCVIGASTDDTSIDYDSGSQIFDVVENQTTYYESNNIRDNTNNKWNLTYYPVLCWNGYYCPIGSSNPRGYGACPTGYYCPGTLTSSYPIICENGTFCPGFGNREYYECGPGTWSKFSTQSLCETCPIGYLCEGVDDLPSICPAGYICSKPGLLLPDRRCPACYYCLDGTNTHKHNAITVRSGYGTIVHETKAVTPILCEAGYYCLSGTATSANNSIRYDVRTPQICPKGFYCEPGSCSPTGSGPCAPGEFCPEGSSQPNITQPGYYTEFYASSNEWICLPGTYSNDSNLDVCDVCPQGYECLNDGTIFPKICESGYFREDLDSIECARCPDGTYSNSTGLTAESDCILCKPGWVCGTPGLTAHPTDTEFLCPHGFVCGNGTNLYESRVTLCPAGFYCNVGTTPYSRFDQPCLAGYFCPNGTSETTMYDRVCPEGYYCPSSITGGVHVQLPCFNETEDADCQLFKCPEGTTTSTGATSLVQCELDCSPPLCTTLNRTNPIHSDIGYNNLTFPSGTIISIQVDWSDIPQQMVYYKHFVMNIYYVESNQSNKYLVDSLDDAESKEPYLYPLGEWFKKRDDVIQHKTKFNLTLFFNKGNVDVFIRVEIIHGTYRSSTHVFDNTVNLTIFTPSRFMPDNDQNDNFAIYAMIRKEDVFAEDGALPFNLITNSSFESITVDLSSNDIHISDIYQDSEEWDLSHDEMFFEFGYRGEHVRDMLIFPWFPYWSSCLTFESRLFISYMLEGGYAHNGTFCTIYDKETELTPVYYDDFMKSPIADHCNFDLTCQYEESLGIGTRARWWELSVGTTVFYLTQKAQSNVEYENGWTVFSELYGNELRYLDVKISRSSQIPTDQPQIPTHITLSIFYYQKDINTKILVEAYLEYDGWIDVPVEETTGQLIIDSFFSNGSVLLENGDIFDLNYNLNINYQPIAYLDILNNLHFDIFPIYILLYVIVGLMIVAFMSLIWILKRACMSKLRNPPLLNLTELTLLYVEPLMSGYLMSLVPAIMVCLVLYGIYLVEYPFGDFSGNYSDIEKLTSTRIEKYRSGRLGYSMILFGLYFVIQGSTMLIPEALEIEFDNVAWNPIKWKRFWLVVVAITASLFFVYLQQFSYSPIYTSNNNITFFVVLFKFIHFMIHLLLEESFKNSLIVSPFIVTMTCIQIIIIIASKTILSFLTNFVTLYLLQFIERMYILPFFRKILKLIPVYNAKIQSQIYWNLGQRFESERYKSYAMDLMDEIDSRSIEPMIENFNKTSCEVLGYLIIPFILYFFNIFYSELRILEFWNINEYDIIYYLLFSLIIIIFIIFSDLMLFNAQEMYHSWPIYQYLKFCRHRFLTRISHWKLSEYEFDETLDPVLRELDSLCFSSQFYFMLGITSFGILFIYLGFSVTLANDYPFVSDSFFFILTIFILFTSMLSTRILVYMFRLSQIWRINKLPIVHYAVNEDETPYDPLQHLRSKPVKNKFLEKNKNWLLQNLSELITADALQRHRDYLLYHYENIVRQKNKGDLDNKYDISDDLSSLDEEEEDEHYHGSIKLDKRQQRVAEWWLNRGRRLTEMKRLVDGIIASNLDNLCNECGDDKGNLNIHQFISFEDLLFQFDKKVKLGIDRMDKMHPVIAWRKFFKNTQLFRTLCSNCLENIQIRNINNKNITVISDDSEGSDETIDFRYQQYQVSFNKTSKSIASLWLQSARSSILRQNPPSIPSLSMSQTAENTDDDDDESIIHISRAPTNNNVIIRDDISSITETEDSNNLYPQRDDITEDTFEESVPSEQKVIFYNDDVENDGEIDESDSSLDIQPSAPVRRRYDISSDSDNIDDDNDSDD